MFFPRFVIQTILLSKHDESEIKFAIILSILLDYYKGLVLSTNFFNMAYNFDIFAFLSTTSTAGTNPIKILQRKFYATLFFKHFDWVNIFSIQSKCLIKLYSENFLL